jgi:hypothetical protein
MIEKVQEVIELAANLSDGDFGKMMSLLTFAAAAATMIPFNNAKTTECSTQRIANRTKAENADIEAAIALFVTNYRSLVGSVRDVAMTFADLATMPPAGKA